MNRKALKTLVNNIIIVEKLMVPGEFQPVVTQKLFPVTISPHRSTWIGSILIYIANGDLHGSNNEVYEV